MPEAPDASRDPSVAVPPWFRRRPRATVAAAVVLYVAVLVLRLSVHGTSDPISLLFCLPVALVAVAFGLTAGLLSGLLAIAGLLTWVIVDEVSISLLGWATRVMPLVLLGVLLGDAADRLQQAEDEKRALAVAAHSQREAAELNDSVVQGLSAAKWALEAGQLDRGLEIVSETLETAQAQVSRLLRLSEAGTGGGRVRRVLFDWHRSDRDPEEAAQDASDAPAANASSHDAPAASNGRKRIT